MSSVDGVGRGERIVWVIAVFGLEEFSYESEFSLVSWACFLCKKGIAYQRRTRHSYQLNIALVFFRMGAWLLTYC